MSVHAPFNDMHSKFRLLRLNRHLRDGLLDLQISNFAIDKPETPQWRAISYMWGDAEATETVYVNERCSKVRPNLYSLLQQLWQRGANDPAYDTHYFVDALCIDQGSLTERAAQVTLMGQIYEKAEAVVIWLGSPLPDESRPLQEIFHAYTEYAKRFYKGDHLDQRRKEKWNASDGWPRPKDLDMTVLEDLSRLPYWERAWIQQEVLLARHIRILFGQHELLGDTVRALVRTCILPPFTLAETHVSNSHVSSIWRKLPFWEAQNSSHYRSRRSWPGADTFRNLDLKNTCSTIPRDKIFAAPSLAANGEGLVVSYEEPSMNLFLRLMILESQKKRFDEPSIVHFSEMLIDVLHLQPTMVLEVDKGIQDLNLPERPSFPLKGSLL